jgi:hypothetical protein
LVALNSQCEQIVNKEQGKPPFAQRIAPWCREAEISRANFYYMPIPDRPRTVTLKGVPYVVESVEAWRSRMANRRTITAFCAAAGISRRSFYQLEQKDRPRMDGGHVVEEPAAWWTRVGAADTAKEAAPA